MNTMKVCRICGEVKPLGEFHVNRKSADGRQSRCKVCACSGARQWNRDNRDRKNERARIARIEWTPERRAQEAAKNKAWRDANAEQVQAHKRAYYEANKESIQERQRAYAASEKGQEVRRRAQENWKARNPRAWYASVLRRNYGMTLDEFDAMVLAQEGRCDICNEPMIKSHEPCVDHCHTAGTVRGLLCAQCNFGLGHFRDRPDLMLRAIDYLTASGTAKSG